MPGLIKATVGRGGKNNPADVKAVQAALNKYAKADLSEDGKCGPKTIKAIENFQKPLKFSRPDGLVEPGQITEQGLLGKKVKGGSAATEEHESEAEAVEAGSVFGVALGTIGAAGVAAAVKAAKMAEASKNETEKVAQQLLNKLKEASSKGAGGEGDTILKELEDAYKENLEHIRKIEAAAKELAKRKTEDAAKALKKTAEESVPGFKKVEKLVEDGSKWLGDKGSEYVKDAKDVASKITKEISDWKKDADKAYHDVMDKLNKTPAGEWDDAGRKIKDELEKAYKQGSDQVKKVVTTARDAVNKETDAALDALKKAAQSTSPVFDRVDDLAKKALDWWNSD
jgi:peptidoglycan hydrolase-like protein with peptidoglycan-binding domain